MYESGLVVAFVLSFIVFFIQGVQRKDSLSRILFGSLFGALMASLLSWLAVVLLVLMFASGKVWGISNQNFSLEKRTERDLDSLDI